MVFFSIVFFVVFFVSVCYNALWLILATFLEFIMATATPVTKTYELSNSERDLVVAALRTHAAMIKRAINVELDSSIKEIRFGHLHAAEALVLRFR